MMTDHTNTGVQQEAGTSSEAHCSVSSSLDDKDKSEDRSRRRFIRDLTRTVMAGISGAVLLATEAAPARAVGATVEPLSAEPDKIEPVEMPDATTDAAEVAPLSPFTEPFARDSWFVCRFDENGHCVSSHYVRDDPDNPGHWMPF